ncbi:arginase [Halomarina oriensis]|uniref:Arginase n=1 Tax=Halomarina oriensis TaxID=671145 RepID=A0A6B0GTK5_9EURY|nr:arginase [Halomarina oriensis]MWG36707.1 arginase [Halomarina oriensis]
MTGPLRIIGVPMDLGADRRGVDMGPSAIRYAGLGDELTALDYDPSDVGDLPVTHPEVGDPDAVEPATGHAKYVAEVRDVCTRLADEVSETLADGAFPLVLGGDHSIAIGSVNGSARDADIGVVWFDAHADFNTPATTPSGNVHGMPVAAFLGEGEFADSDWAPAGVDPSNVALVGIRSVDASERAALADSDVTVFTMSDIDERGITDVTEDALDVASDGTDGIHVSLDLDWLDPNEAPGVGTPVRGGVTYREAHAALERTAQRDVRSMEVVEVNPILDRSNRTAELAVELAASGLGKRII